MNINDFKNAYDGIHATPELKKRALEKAAADSEAKNQKKRYDFLVQPAALERRRCLSSAGRFLYAG